MTAQMISPVGDMELALKDYRLMSRCVSILNWLCLEHLAGDFAVLDVQGEGRLAARTGQQRVGGMDVALGLEERGEDGLQIGGAAGKFDDDERDLGEGEPCSWKSARALSGSSETRRTMAASDVSRMLSATT